MWRGVNTAGGVGATWLLAAAAHAGPGPGGWAGGWDSMGAEPPAPPDAADTVRAYLTAADWLHRFTLPRPDDPAARLEIASSSGVCLIVRHAGRVLGLEIDAGGDDLMLRRAASAAFRQALADRVVQSLPEAMRERAGASMILELEVAGELVPMVGRSGAQIDRQVEPGLDGVALRRGDAVAMLFPAQLMAGNRVMHLGVLAPGLAADLGLEGRDLGAILAHPEVSVYRFRTTHLAQAEPGRSPFELIRGHRIVLESDVNFASIQSLADDLAGHVGRGMAYRGPDDAPDLALGLMGDYHPARDAFDPLLAAPLEQALLAFALARYAAVPTSAADRVERARTVALRVLRDLAVVEAAETDPRGSVAACAAVVHAVAELPGAIEDRPIRDLFTDATATLERAWRDEIGFVEAGFAETGGPAPERRVPGHAQALAAAAWARLLLTPLNAAPPPPARLAEAIDLAWTHQPEHQRLSLLPWLGWADRDLATAMGRPMRLGEELLRVIRALEATRIDRRVEGAAPDLYGAFALSGRGSRRLDPRRADAQSLRPAAFMATALRDRGMLDRDAADRMVPGHLLTLRYLAQLTVREADRWSLRNPDVALGGVRASTWDSRQPAAAQALGLLTAAETLISLGELNARD